MALSRSFAEGRARLVRWTLWVVATQTAVASIRGAAHVSIPVPVASPVDAALILGAVYLGPVLGAALLLRSRRALGAQLLAVSYSVALAYGTLSHFALAGPDNIGSVPGPGWGSLFMITAASLSVLEGLGLVLASGLLRASPRAAPPSDA